MEVKCFAITRPRELTPVLGVLQSSGAFGGSAGAEPSGLRTRRQSESSRGLEHSKTQARIGNLLCVVCCLLSFTACRRDLADQPRLKPLGPSTFFADGAASRPVPAHTVSREEAAAPAPARVTRALLERGRERYDIYCSVCHGRTGEGQGMIVQRGFPAPPTFHQPRLREAPAQHYFDVITNGFGLMYSYRARVAPADRWAIVAYIRALQLSHHAALADATPEARTQLEAQAP